MLRPLVVFVAVLVLAACDSSALPSPASVTYTVSRSGEGVLNDVTVRYTDGDGRSVTVAAPSLPYTQTVSTARSGPFEVEASGTYVGSAVLVPVTLSASVRGVRAGQNDLTDTRTETVASNTTQTVRVSARVTLP